jgi:nitrogen regulatory protein P-II 1
MKKVETVIRSDRFEAVKNALATQGFTSLTTYEVKGRGKQSGILDTIGGQKVRADLLPKTKIEIVAEDADVEVIINIIVDNAATGTLGDGKIFVSPIEQVVRVRTKEENSKAL